MTTRHTPAAIYRANRAAGVPARYALAAARHITATLQALEGMTAEFIYSERVEARYTTEDTNAGVTVTYELWRDLDTRPEEIGDCYSPEDITAWESDEWHYYGVTVTATMGRFEVSEVLGGIDAGDYWESPARPLDTEQQVMSTALEHYSARSMVEAVQDAAIRACLS